MSFEKLFRVAHLPSIPRELYLSPRSFSKSVLAERSNLRYQNRGKTDFSFSLLLQIVDSRANSWFAPKLQETQITMLQCTIAGGRTKEANDRSLVFVHKHGGDDVT